LKASSGPGLKEMQVSSECTTDTYSETLLLSGQVLASKALTPAWKSVALRSTSFLDKWTYTCFRHVHCIDVPWRQLQTRSVSMIISSGAGNGRSRSGKGK
jgi:hypothetical protein